MRNLHFISVSFALALFVLGGCASDMEIYKEKSISDLYNEGKDELREGSYTEAARAFDEVERQHPYSKWATHAQLMSAYAYYLDQKYTRAIDLLDAFIQLHPGNPDIAYAYYLQGLCYYEQIPIVQRDQGVTKLALKSFGALVQRFPGSKYTKAAYPKIDLARDHLAGQQMEIGRFYSKRQAHLAAINRFRRVVDDYQRTSHVPEALCRLVESYLSIGLEKEAREVAAILGYNFPGNPWYADSYYLLEGVDMRSEETLVADYPWYSKVWEKIKG